MQDSTAQERQDCCCSMSLSPTSSEAEDVFPAGTCTHVYTRDIHICIASHTDHRQTEHPYKHRQHQCPHLLHSPAGQDGGSLVRIYIHTYVQVDTSSSCVQTFRLSSSCPLDCSLPSCWQPPLVQKVNWRAVPNDSQRWAPHLDQEAEGFPGTALGRARTMHSFLRSPWFGFPPATVPLCSSGLVGMHLW